MTHYCFGSGADNPSWNGGKKIASGGYIMIRNPNHPNCDSCGYVMEHRLVMEKRLGRYLHPWEDVHHINKDKTDNRIENLVLMTHSEHLRLEKTIDTTDRICSICGSDETEIWMVSGRPRPHWYRNRQNAKPVCKRCYNREYNSEYRHEYDRKYYYEHREHKREYDHERYRCKRVALDSLARS